ncbi:alpha/beta fold hydrolase [Pontibacillus salicampi]
MMLHYVEYDNGNPEWVVCLHAICTGHFIFKGQLACLSEKFNVLLIDLPAHYGSGDVEVDYADPFRHTTRLVLEVLDAVGIKKAHFVGISLGSIVAHTIMMHHPERVNRVVLGGAVIRFPTISNRILAATLFLFPVLSHRFVFLSLMYYMMPKRHHLSVNRQIWEGGRNIKRKAFIGWVRALHTLDRVLPLEALDQLEIPRLFISGEEDHSILPGLLPYTDVSIIPGCGHMVNMEQADLFNQKMMPFLMEEV